jgi:hypothetical protein
MRQIALSSLSELSKYSANNIAPRLNSLIDCPNDLCKLKTRPLFSSGFWRCAGIGLMPAAGTG